MTGHYCHLVNYCRKPSRDRHYEARGELTLVGHRLRHANARFRIDTASKLRLMLSSLSSSIWRSRSLFSRSHAIEFRRYYARGYTFDPCSLCTRHDFGSGFVCCSCRWRRKWGIQDSHYHRCSHSGCFTIRYVPFPLAYSINLRATLMRIVPFAIKAEQGDTLEYIWGGGPVSSNDILIV